MHAYIYINAYTYTSYMYAHVHAHTYLYLYLPVHVFHCPKRAELQGKDQNKRKPPNTATAHLVYWQWS